MKKDSPQKSKSFFENNSWYHRTKTLQEDGSIKYSKKGGFATSKEADKSYDQCEAAFTKAYRAYQIAHQVNKEIMLKDYLIYWFEEVFSQRVESTTRMVGAYAIYDLIMPHLEYDIKVRYVNVDYLDTLLAEVAKASPSAGNKGREILNLALKEAVIAGYIKTNPVTGTKPYKRSKPKITILSKAKIKILLKAASKNNWYLEILLALFCGLRKGEIMGLKFCDFDFEKNTVYINRQIASDPKIKKGSGSKIDEYGLVERDPKTPNSFRTLRVPEVVMAEVKKRKLLIEKNKEMQGDEYSDRDYISCQENGKLHSVTALNNALTKLCSRSGLPHLTVHGLRHMYATILIEMGVPLIKISALLGHSSVHTTFEYYCDVMDENENILAFMNQAFVPVGADEVA
ncbi:site-specific integrase [[Clostridium] scindens]|uniref:site-specific integrase n=1 Tax=Clostridium scindens (strain JCM 10418 / VPI 12708) TaxID=29347 RepID=UPI002675D1CE|nr:site-specific integrase [[Clostridium] scindens]